MRILILNRFALALVPYREYIDAGHELALITSAGGVSRDGVAREQALSGYDPVAVLDDYGTSAHVEALAHRWHAERPFDAVLSLSEFDLLTAARLRGAWGIAGQTLESVLAFRDKNLMKRQLAAAGLPVARFAAVDNTTDLLAFIAQVGLPVVVKPRRGASSAGVRVLRDDGDVQDYLGAGSPIVGDRPADLQVEEYVEHEMYNVDGLVVDGQLRVCWPSWTTSGLGFLAGEGQLAASLEADEPWQRELVELVAAVLRVLPTPPTTIFHAEVFRAPHDRLVFNEIGCRIGGARIWDQVRIGLGVDLLANCIKGLYGRPGSVSVPHTRPVRQTGWVLVVARPGKIASVPEQCPVPGVAIYDPYVAVGDLVGPPDDVTEAAAAVVAVGDSRAEVEATLRASVAWFHDAIEYVAE